MQRRAAADEWHPRGASRSRWAEPMARRQVPGHDSVWPDLARGLDAPALAICQRRSASTDLGPVLPSYPRSPSTSQAIFISSPCHLSLKVPISPLPPSLPLAHLEFCCPVPDLLASVGSRHRQPRRDRQGMLAVGACQACSQKPCCCQQQHPYLLPRSSGPEADCQMLVNPLNLHAGGVGLVLRGDGTLGFPPYSGKLRKARYKECCYSVFPPLPPFLGSVSIFCQCCCQLHTRVVDHLCPTYTHIHTSKQIVVYNKNRLKRPSRPTKKTNPEPESPFAPEGSYTITPLSTYRAWRPLSRSRLKPRFPSLLPRNTRCS